MSQLRSRTRRWLPIQTEIMPPRWTPCVVDQAPDLDPATVMAIDERTWPRGSSRVFGVVTPDDPAIAAADRRIPRYELGALLGRGGMGEVFAAYDSQIGREVAIKRLHRAKLDSSSLARFAMEARIQGWLDHPAIPSVYELGCDDEGRPFFVMKRLSGISLDELLAERGPKPVEPARFSERQLLGAFVEICLAVEFAHTRGVVHRDLKPSNVLLGQFGEVYVLDWGVAQVLDRAGDDAMRPTIELVSAEGVLGTPGYMAPEQVAGEPLDGRADVYALGCILFEIVVGQPLHPAGFAGLTSALAGVETSASSYRADLAPELDELCRHATTADRTRRIGSARVLGEAVQRYLDGDRDIALRRRLARSHFEAAYRASQECARQGTRYSTDAAPSGDARLDLEATAMREAGRALALDPTLPGAAELVGRLMLQPSVRLPPAVVGELEEAKSAERARMSRIAIAIYAGYVGLAPLLLLFGIRDVAYLSALVVVAGSNIAIARWSLARPHMVPRVVIAIGHAVMFGLIARMFTPLLIAPGITAVTLMAYAQHPSTTRRELILGNAFAVVAVLGVLAAELLGWIGATTVVEDGVIHLTSPLDGAAAFPIIPALCCHMILLVSIAGGVTFDMARRDRAAQRKLHVQAWQLRQLSSLDASVSRTRP